MFWKKEKFTPVVACNSLTMDYYMEDAHRLGLIPDEIRDENAVSLRINETLQDGMLLYNLSKYSVDTGTVMIAITRCKDCGCGLKLDSHVYTKPKYCSRCQPAEPAELPIPEIYSIWEHDLGDRYQVLLVTNTDIDGLKKDRFILTVCYRKMSNNKIYSRTLDSWREHFKPMDK